jgi:glycosyltransferase involved in cell wall biosynthesis
MEMVDSPHVSIVIPCYRGARFLPQAIESCLRQTLRDFEVIVVDDASPDNCAEIAERYAQSDDRIRVIRREKNGGVSEAFNTGFRAARGRIFTRLAQDDFFCDDALARIAVCLYANPEVGLIYGDGAVANQEGATILYTTPPDPESALLFGNRVGLGVAWRREAWDRVGGFNSEFDTAEDYEYWIRVWNHYPIKKCPGPALITFRSHDQCGSITSFERQEKATLRILRECYPKRVSPPWRRLLYRRAAISRILFGAATDYRRTGRNGLALSRLMNSFAYWPFPFQPDLAKGHFGRIRFLLSLALSGG